MEKTWKDIKGYEGLYQISNLGNVKSLRKNKILKPFSNHGYMQVRLYKENNKKDFKIHRLVANAFITNYYCKPEINHIDGNKQNNNVDNLEWCTRKENEQHAVKYGLHNYEAAIKKTSKKVKAINIKTKEILSFKSLSHASRELKIDCSNICNCCKNKIKSIGGYKFNYDN